MKNKILSKYLFPYYVVSSVCFGISAFSMTLMKEDSITRKMIFQHDSLNKQHRTDTFICIYLVVIAAALGIIGIWNIPKNARNKTAQLAKQYMEDVMKKHPEIQGYKWLLDNPQCIQHIATVVCNELDQGSQEQILTLINSTFDGSDKSDKRIKKAEEQIMKIIERCATQKPEYLQKVINSVYEAFQIYYIIPQSQNTR